MNYKEILGKVTNKEKLTKEEIYHLIGAINKGTVSDVQIAGFQVALLMKGASKEEIAYIACAMRDNCVPIKVSVSGDLMDTCGTGGGQSTFNISTATAIMAAAAGIKIAKHGSRSLASLSGSADVLEALGVNINLNEKQIAYLIEKISIAFLYAPLFHPVMGKVLPSESDLGIKTIFYTIIGPLINPAFARRHLLGVYKEELLDTVTFVASEMGYKKAMFVYGKDGLDEISLLGETSVNMLENGKVEKFIITPEQFGLKRCKIDDIKSDTPCYNARIIEKVFSGELKDANKDAVVLNTAGALVVGGKAKDLITGVKYAKELIESGLANKKLDELKRESNSF